MSIPTKSLFERIAEIIKTARHRYPDTTAQKAIGTIETGLSELFQRLNPHFEEDRFRQACLNGHDHREPQS
jgi:hypothetical protein